MSPFGLRGEKVGKILVGSAFQQTFFEFPNALQPLMTRLRQVCELHGANDMESRFFSKILYQFLIFFIKKFDGPYSLS